MRTPRVTVHIDENGGLGAVDVEGHRTPTELEISVPSQPIPGFGDEEFKDRLRPWAAGA